MNHILYDVDIFVATARGTERGSADVDRLGDDWLAAYRAASRDLIEAWQARGTQGTLTTSFGELPLSWALGQQMADLAVHSWDVARSLGEPIDALDEQVGQVSLTWLSENLRPEFRGQAFGPEVPVAASAPLYDRLAAFSGRPIA